MGNQENMFTRSDTGDRYLAYRPSYPQELYDHILSYHDSSPGAARELCVDLGCGPGIVTRAIAPAFNKTIGVDPSESMIDTAKRVEGQQGIEYMVGSAEDLKGIEDASVDLAIGGTMAHWLQPESWYTEMARVLRPGGTIAVFAYAWAYPSHDTQNYAKIRKMTETMRSDLMSKTGQKGNAITDDLYRTLQRPEEFPSIAPAFEKSVYKCWDADEQAKNGEPYLMAKQMRLQDFVNWYKTAGPMVKFQEVDPEGAKAYLKRAEDQLRELTGLGENDTCTIVRSIGLVMIKKK